jgi:copper resistance protein B
MTHLSLKKVFSALSVYSALSVVSLLGLSAQHTAHAEDMMYGLKIDELEYRRGDEKENLLAWSSDAFIGLDELKFHWLSSGEQDRKTNKFTKLENQAVLQVPISTFFDAKAGIRLDTPKGANRTYGVLGVTGLAPQWFEVDANLFVSEHGDSSARHEAGYEVLLTNRLILTPSVELNVAFSDDKKVGVGAGVSTLDTGMRISYDVLDRTIAPYIGVLYEQTFGKTADFAREDNDDVEGFRLVIGTKFMF